ncbi:hypothetical protein [Rhodophyticola porphyridii]|uniref:hypothetical protein n=1 Tax=Rhodophyticola porphyridii TaxID=1852017 RepID=UPI0035CF1E9E
MCAVQPLQHLGPGDAPGLHPFGELVEIVEARGVEHRRDQRGGIAHGDEELHLRIGKEIAQLGRLPFDHRPDLCPLNDQPVDADEARIRQDEPVAPVALRDGIQQRILNVLGGGRALQRARRIADHGAIAPGRRYDNSAPGQFDAIFQ